MGLIMNTGSVIRQLENMNTNLRKAIENAKNVMNDISALEEDIDTLVGNSYDSIRNYYCLLHIPIVQGVIHYAEVIMNENNIYKRGIEGHLAGIGYVDEEALREDLQKIDSNIVSISGIMNRKGYPSSCIGLLDNLMESKRLIEKKLKQIGHFKSATSDCYQGLSVYQSLLHRALICMKDDCYDNTTQNYDIDSISEELLGIINALWSDRADIKFQKTMQVQFGFDDRTVQIMWEVYENVQAKYPEMSQIERDWYFARILSQMSSYDSKKVWKIETNAWRNGAGWVFKYDKGNKYFLKELGISEEDYNYLRGMIRLQQFINSSPDKYSYATVEQLANDKESKEEFENWVDNMAKTTGRTFTKEEYLDYYKELYYNFKNKGDFAHMMYTISANLIDKGHKVDNKWENAGAPELSWNTAEERKKIAGWLGDAVYMGEDNTVSFGNDDFISDLDADNISNRVHNGSDLLTAMNEYYNEISPLSEIGKEEYRVKEFLSNNPYEGVEQDILNRIEFEDADSDGEKTLEDIINSTDYYKQYEDTCDFLLKLQSYMQ